MAEEVVGRAVDKQRGERDILGWSDPRLTKQWVTPASQRASKKANDAVYLSGSITISTHEAPQAIGTAIQGTTVITSSLEEEEEEEELTWLRMPKASMINGNKRG